MPSPSPRSLLAVFAHPDDETFGPGGTLALYARRGVAVHLLCASRGEVGSAPAELLRCHGSVAELREAELRCAAEHLGLSSIHFLDYRDSGMPGSPDNHHPRALVAAPLEQVAAQVGEWMRRLQPQVVITFDPMGGYCHPDHIAVHRATVQAFESLQAMAGKEAAYRPRKLYYHTFPRRTLRLFIRLMRSLGHDPRRWGRNRDIDLTAMAGEDIPIHARIDVRSVAQVKRRASACHASQGGGSSNRATVWLLRLLGGWETFSRAYPPADRLLREKDLFQGLPVS
ncbi:MAG: PIG-L family deacetylase [Chloroflexota bacterium]